MRTHKKIKKELENTYETEKNTDDTEQDDQIYRILTNEHS